MAYMSQEHKAELAPAIKAILKKYKMKGSIAVRHYSELVVNIRSGELDIIGNHNNKNGDYDVTYIQVNQNFLANSYSGDVLNFLTELVDAMTKDNYNNSDIMSDYHDVGWYISINVGKWNKPYVCTVKETA